MLRLCCLLLLTCGWWVTPLHAQSVTERMEEVLRMPPDTNKVKSISALVDELFEEMVEIPDTLFEEGVALAQKLDYPYGLMLICFNRYIYYMNGGEVDKALHDVHQVMEYSRQLGLKYYLNLSMLDEVQILINGGRTEEAATKANALLKYFQEFGDTADKAEAYSLLSTIYSSYGDYERAVRYDQESIALARKYGLPTLLIRVFYAAASNLHLMGRAEEALPLVEEAVLVAQTSDYPLDMENALSVRAEVYVALGRYEEAQADYDKLPKGEGYQQVTWRMINQGILLQRTGKHAASREKLLEAVAILQATSQDPLELRSAYRALQTVGLNQQQYDTVAYYGSLMNAQQDSMQQIRNMRNLLDLEKRYQAEEKEAQIKAQQTELTRRRNLLLISVGGLILTLAGLAGFYLLSRSLRRRNAENEQLIAEKETLISEVHHRVKNNLQVISSLLRLQHQGLAADDKMGQETLLDSQRRISAMGLIHNKLYQEGEMTSVDMKTYLTDLGNTLLDAYQIEDRVEIYYDVEDINMDVDTAIPLGLIVNELITNALKYAYPNDREGTIEVALHRNGPQLKLIVSDDGVGVAAAEERADSTSFGTKLIGLLAKKLKASLSVKHDKGYEVNVDFKL